VTRSSPENESAQAEVRPATPAAAQRTGGETKLISPRGVHERNLRKWLNQH
jgi:hypothetical protein